jgi:hypothetical protein
MFRHIAGFELRFQLKSPVFWVTAIIFFTLVFFAVASDNVTIGSGGNVHKNAPFAIAETQMVMSVFALFIMTAFVANVVIRDDETGFAPMIRATRVSKFDYLFGRFTGAFIVGCLAFLSVPLGMIVGAFMPWLDPETLGPFRLGDYAYVPRALRADAVRNGRRFLCARDGDALDAVDVRRADRVTGAVPARERVLRKARVCEARGLRRPVRARCARSHDAVLDRERAQHAAAAADRPFSLEPAAVGRRRVRAARARVDGVQQGTQAPQESQDDRARTGRGRRCTERHQDGRRLARARDGRRLEPCRHFTGAPRPRVGVGRARRTHAVRHGRRVP